MADLLKQRQIFYDGLKAVPIDGLPASAWRWYTPQAEPDDKRREYFEAVPWLFRGVQLRADAVSTLPFGIFDDADNEVDSSADYQNVVGFMPEPFDLLYLVEAALVLLNYAYVFKERNDFGLLDTRYLLPTSITPKINEVTGDITFERQLRTGSVTLTTDDLMYFWGRDPYIEIGPPQASPGKAAVAASGVLFNVDEFAAGFFARGAIKATLLTTPTSNPAEKKKLKAWWDRFIRGISNAWEAAVISAQVEPVVVGEGISELENSDLSKEKREDIATALGIPVTKLWSSQASGLGGGEVVKRDDIVFYRETVIPESKFIERTMDTQLFAGTGYRLRFRPESLDVFQADEKERSGSYLTYVTADIPPSIAAQMLGLELPPGVEYEHLDAFRLAAQAQPVNGPQEAEQDVNITLAKAVNADLKRWRKKARKNADATFVSNFIPPHMQNAIKWAIGRVGPERAFDFLKQADVGSAEAAMQDAVGKVLAKWLPKITGQVARNETPDLQGLKDDLNRVLEPQLVAIATEQALRAAQNVGVEFDVAVVNDEAAGWARTYSFELVSGLVETTRKRVGKAIEQYTTTPGMTRGELEALLEPAFGAARAEMIAVTEVTRAYAQASNQYQQMIRDEAGVEMARIWQTNADELVCPICGPLNGQNEGEWGLDFPDGPPAHVNCILPGNVVSVPGLIAGSKSLYVGRAIEIRTEGGRCLTVTPYHPILTSDGWTGAQFINEGEQVIVHTAPERVASSIYPDYNHMPTAIEKVFSALKMSDAMARCRVPSSAEDFHGDGLFVYGNIDVVGPNGLLLGDIKAALTELYSEVGFNGNDMDLAGLQGDSAFALFGPRDSASLNSLMSSGDLVSTALGRHLRPLEEFSIGPAPAIDSSFKQNAFNSGSGNFELAREFVLRNSRFIEADKVISVRQFDFSGHVYDLQSGFYRLYISNGIVSSNCRCFVTLEVV